MTCNSSQTICFRDLFVWKKKKILNSSRIIYEESHTFLNWKVYSKLIRGTSRYRTFSIGTYLSIFFSLKIFMTVIVIAIMKLWIKNWPNRKNFVFAWDSTSSLLQLILFWRILTRRFNFDDFNFVVKVMTINFFQKVLADTCCLLKSYLSKSNFTAINLRAESIDIA